MKVAVSGYYGCGNAGDEAVLAGITEAFREVSGDATQIVALSQNPTETTRLHGIPSAFRMSPKIVRQTLRESQLLISGGGSLLQDTTSFKSLIYYLWVVRVALSMKLPVMFYAQGLGPLRRPLSRLLVRLTANRVNAITVRDEASKQLLAQIGVRRPPVEVTADPAFALPLASKSTSLKLWEREGLSSDSRPRVAVALRPWETETPDLIARYANLLTEIEAQSGAQTVLLPMQIPGDLSLSERVAEATGRPDDFPILSRALPPSDILNLVSQMDSVIAMRLHTLIFAARAAVSPYALSYDPKVDNLMNLLELPDQTSHWKDFDPAEVAGRVSLILTERSLRRPHLKEKAEILKKKALRNAEIALSLLK